MPAIQDAVARVIGTRYSDARSVASGATAAFGRMGFVRRGRSRTWVADRGWWRLNVEPALSLAAGVAYLNVGEQHLSVERHHLVFESMEHSLGGATVADLDSAS
jgi:hypothetical protein